MDMPATPPSPSTLTPTEHPSEAGEQASAITVPTSVPATANGQPPSPPAAEVYTKRLLPDTLSSPFPHGLITGEARTLDQQAALDARKAEILAKMTADQIEESYQDTVKKVQEVLQEIKEGNDKIDKEIEDAKKTREMERRAWLGMKKAAAEGEI